MPTPPGRNHRAKGRSDFGGNPADHEGNQATVAQCHAQRCTFESRHRDLVENGLVRSDPELGRKLKTGAAAIRDCSNRGGIILDPFGGAGTTLIAAERTGRRARLIEIDSHFVT
jgi:hypothetical protein